MSVQKFYNISIVTLRLHKNSAQFGTMKWKNGYLKKEFQQKKKKQRSNRLLLRDIFPEYELKEYIDSKKLQENDYEKEGSMRN